MIPDSDEELDELDEQLQGSRSEDAATVEAETDAAKPFSVEGSSLGGLSMSKATTDLPTMRSKQPKWVDEDQGANLGFFTFWGFLPSCCKNVDASPNDRVGIMQDTLPRYPQLAVEPGETPA